MKRLLTAAAISVLALAPVPVQAQAPPPPPGAIEADLKVSPRQATPGESVTASGLGCDRETSVEFKLYAPALISTGEIESSNKGYFEADIEIPSDLPEGRAWLVAQCENPDEDQLVLEQTIVVTRPPVVITGVNLMFGGGVTFIVAGVGVMMRRRLPGRRRRRAERPSS